jgi:hypothetical protein
VRLQGRPESGQEPLALLRIHATEQVHVQWRFAREKVHPGVK